MWRHLVAIAAAIALTLVFLEFWGEFGGAMTTAVKISADSGHDKPMPVTVITSDAGCAKDAPKNIPCPDAPTANPAPNPNGGP